MQVCPQRPTAPSPLFTCRRPPAMRLLAVLLLLAPAGGRQQPLGEAPRRVSTTQEYVVVASCACTFLDALCECPAGATLGEAFAAQELAHMLGNISNGAEPLPIVNATAVLPGTRWIAVGYSASVALGGVQPAELAGLGLEGFRIAPLPNGCFAVSGGQGAKRGAMYGVYELLEQLGLEFMAWDLTVFPPGAPHADLPTLLKTLPATATVQQPSFMYRDLGEWPIYSNRLHGRRMRLNNNAHLECTEDTANRWCKTENPDNMWDSFVFADPPGMAHTVYKLLCSNGTSDNPNGHCDNPLKPPQDLIKTHPEWFWPHGDANTYGQVCYHNKSLVSFLISQVQTILQHQPHVPWLSVTQNDNMADCMDPAELAILKEEGGHRSGNQLRVVNAIADAVADDYPVLIDTFAYEQTSRVPALTKPSPNVIVRLATTWCNSLLPINDTGQANTGSVAFVESWSNVSKHLSVWDYTANYDSPVMPYPDWMKWGDNFKFEHERGVIGYYGEGNAYQLPGRDLAELAIYLQSKLLWNVEHNATELIAKFLKNYYGAATPHVMEYMTVMTASVQAVGGCKATGGDGGEGYPATAAFLSPEAVVKGAIALAAGRAAVAEDPARLGRIDRARLGVSYVLLLRWEEMHAYATSAGLAWPAEPTQAAAFQHFATVANETARVLRGHFMYEAYVQPIGQVGRFTQGAFGHPKGKTTAGGNIPYLDWLQLQLQWKSGVPGSDAWCQPGYNTPKANAACWQNCSQVFRCLEDKSGGTCDTDQYCRGDEPPPKRQRSPARERAVAGQVAATTSTKRISWYSERPVTAAAVDFALTSGLVDGLLPCCNLLQINCTTGTLQHEPGYYNFSMFAPFLAAGKSVSVSLEGISSVGGVEGMAECCANATHCPMLESKEILAQQLLQVALKFKLSSYTGDWEFNRGNPTDFSWRGWNQTMAHIASVLNPHGVGLGNSISSGCIAFDETRCAPDGGHADPTCCPASRDVPWADVLTDMYAYHIGDAVPDWSKNGTRGSCGPLMKDEDPVTQQYCGWEGPLMNTLHSPIATVHADRAPQLSPALWLGDCLDNGTSVHGWTQPKLETFLQFLDTQGITSVSVWCMTDGHDPIGFPCPGVKEHCPWQYDELTKWKARQAAPASEGQAAAAAAALPSTLATTASKPPWKQDRFAIGFWVDPMVPPARFDAEYRIIADANFTILLGGYGATKPPEVKLQIAAARRAGLAAIPSFCGGGCANLSGPGVCSPGRVWGFQVIDEPQIKMFPAVAKLVAQAKLAGDMAFVNLFPDYAFGPHSPFGPSYSAYVKQFVRDVKPNMLSLDNYPHFDTAGGSGCVSPPCPAGPQTKANYIANLLVIREAALEAGIPFMNFVKSMPYGSQASGSPSPYDVSESEMRWQVMTSLALGAKGVMYFCYWTPSGAYFSLGQAIMTPAPGSKPNLANQVPGPKYPMVHRINSKLRTLGEWLLERTSSGFIQASGGRANTTAIEGCAGIASINGTNVGDAWSFLLGLFDTNRTVLLVNQDANHPALATLALRGDGEMHEVDPDSGDLKLALDDAPFAPGFQLSVNAGDARLFTWETQV